MMKAEQRVTRNVARLWQIERDVKTEQDLLNALHPWHGKQNLKFNQQVCFLYALSGGLILLCCFLLKIKIGFVVGCILLILAYLNYHSDRGLNAVIQALEQKMIQVRYDLAFNHLPSHLPFSTQSLFLFNQLKQHFSTLFSAHSSASYISRFASTNWQINQQDCPVLLFEYVNIIEIKTHDEDGTKISWRKEEHRQWGAFIFKMPALGIAINNTKNPFKAPYQVPWNTSDIQMNEYLYIRGYDDLQLAKNLTPHRVVQFDQFFKQQTGDLIFHYEQDIACFLGLAPLFEMHSQHNDIKTISNLRGHLRTSRLLHYEQFKKQMITLLSSL